jgi:hypothetical protein
MTDNLDRASEASEVAELRVVEKMQAVIEHLVPAGG